MERIKILRRIARTNRMAGQGGYDDTMPWYKKLAYIVGLLFLLFIGMSADSLMDILLKAVGF